MTLSATDVPSLVRQLRSSRRVMRAQAVRALGNLADPNNDLSHLAVVNRLVAADGVTSLVQLLALDDSSAAVQEAVLLLLADVALGNPGARAVAACPGAIPRLIRLLQNGISDTAQRGAALALSRLAHEGPDQATAVVAAGGIEAWVQHLSTSGARASTQLQEAAVVALHDICTQCPQSSRGIVAAGAVPLLLQLLLSSGESTRRSAMRLLQHLTHVACSGASSAVEAAGSIPALVSLVRDDTTPIMLLSNLAADSRSRQQAIADARGIPLLVGHLCSSSADVRAAAANICAGMAHGSPQLALALAEAGAIPALAAALHKAHEGELEDVDILTSNRGTCSSRQLVIEQATKALACSAATGQERCREIAAAGTISVVVGLLHSSGPTESMQYQAAALLRTVAELCPDLAPAIAAAGGITALDQLAQSSSGAHWQEVREAAAQALQALHIAEAQGMPRPPVSSATACTAPRVCAAPGCGNMCGLKRCGGCRSVRYCGEACRNAHWPEHKAECRRLQAAAAAPGAANT